MARERFAATSRYILDKGGITASRRPQERAQYRMYTVQPRDTIEVLAYRLLGDTRRWWEIADLNPQLYLTDQGKASLLLLEPGTVIRVPS